MRFVLWLRKALEKAMDILSIILFSGVFVAVLLQIFCRYVLGSPLVWSEELSRILFIWVALIGWTLAMRHGSHLRIEFLMDKMPAGMRRGMDLTFMACNLFFMGFLTWIGVRMVGRSTYIPTTTMPFISTACIYAALPFSSLVCIIYIILDSLEILGVLPRANATEGGK
ncbi:MAG: TRAP transporter small permease [Planctomycetota bacterium]|jgi:TRAP-type C4-dicarboxylate transport system permease small subunit|nr:TRAP transporter small permease [Planctomycetota bacterium]